MKVSERVHEKRDILTVPSEDDILKVLVKEVRMEDGRIYKHLQLRITGSDGQTAGILFLEGSDFPSRLVRLFCENGLIQADTLKKIGKYADFQ